MQNSNSLSNINERHVLWVKRIHTRVNEKVNLISALYIVNQFLLLMLRFLQVDRETELFEITSQLNQLLLKTIHWFEALESLHA